MDAHEEARRIFEGIASKETMEVVKAGAEPFSPATYEAIKHGDIVASRARAKADAEEMNLQCETEG